jgi:hypothetical protein
MSTTDLHFERINYTATETGKVIRRALRDVFPGVRFSLKGSRGTGHGWFALSWTDGPTTFEVDKVTGRFRSSYFDGMDDSTHQIPATMYADADGVIREHRYTCHGVNTQRDYSEEARAWARAYVDTHGGPERFSDYPGAGYDAATWQLFQGVNLSTIDLTTLPVPEPGWSGRHVATSYAVDTRTYAYTQQHGAHRAEVSA